MKRYVLPFVVCALLASFLSSVGLSAISRDSASAAAMSPTDETKVPHYFGPYPNWANSPQVLADAVVKITGGGGTGAEATATVDPKTGGISAIDVISPGTGYTAPPDVQITGAGITPTQSATATATISPGVLTSITVNEAGFGFTAPTVTITGGNPTPGLEATAEASGGVDNLKIVNGGSGYTVQPIVRFSLPDLPDGVQATGSATMDANGVVNGVTVVEPGSGYTSAPTVTILDGAQLNPTGASVEATIGIGKVDVTNGGEGYDTAPTVTITDTVGTPDKGATASANVSVKGGVTGITVDTPGAGYLTPGLKKFVDTLPGLGEAKANDLGQYIPVAVPDTTTYPGTDYYEIAVVQYRMKFHKDLPPTLLRGYVQLSTNAVPGRKVALTNANLDPAKPDTPIANYTGVDNPHYLGPTIVAQKNKPVRILFRNLLPTGADGNLFLPVDTSMMGSGAGPDMMKLDANGVPMDMAADEGTVIDGVRNPMCNEIPKPRDCFAENRATLHLHGGITPWISDGTPHQWVTPDGENTAYPKGVSVSNVPDMPDPGPGAQTFFYTNQQSARLMFYHDHAWGITRLNVYAGEAAAYLITDKMEKDLIAPGGALDGLGTGDPLVIQDKTFVPGNVTATDPTWDKTRWGGEGSLWIPHVYMPAQNPGSKTGMSPFGRWMYGPWFWPPAKNAKYPPIANPYYDPTCDPGVQPFCEPPQIPSTPNLSTGMEAFHDTPVVNGTAYPTTTVDPKSYRYRILNGSNDRFWNLSWYVADPTTGTLSEVALNPADLAAAQTNPNVIPQPDTTKSPKGPNWIQIGTEGGFLPAPVTVPAQPVTYITDPTRFDVGNVDKHSLLLAPAERADVIVDFSAFRGKTLILYNDAPAAFPARVPFYDYYTGRPDLRPAGAPSTLPGYGPNTRTVMQVKVSTAAPDTAFDRAGTTADRMGALQAAFAHHLDANGNPAGVFEKSQNPVIVGQADYNSAYGTSFVGTGDCSAPTNPTAKCDGYARINQQGGDLFKFDTLSGAQLSIPLQPKGIHDEMNSASFDEWGRMTANMGLEAPGATPLLQNIILYPYTNPATEVLDSTGLPSSLNVTPIASAADGTQIWKITHNGVDTHPLHWHLYDVQVLNRVTWDNIIIPPDPTELGWKDTVRVSPLEDTIVAVRPIVPTIPFGLPDSKRPLNPMMPIGARGSRNGVNGTEAGFNNTDANGQPIAPIVNNVENFGWEYVWHCHMLSHEEMDMMRPVTVKVDSVAPDASVVTATRGAAVDVNWTDGTPVDYADPNTWSGPKSEIGFRVERAPVVDGVNGAFEVIARPLANQTHYVDHPPVNTATYAYRVVAWNKAGETVSNESVIGGGPLAPTGLTATVESAPQLPSGSQVRLDWTNNAADAANVIVERVAGAGAYSVIATLDPTAQTFTDTAVNPGQYNYRVKAVTVAGASSEYAGPASVDILKPASATTLVSSVDPSLVGQSVTFTATVTPVLATASPTGTVDFTVDGGAPTTATVDATGAATFTTTSLGAGTHTIAANYSGDTMLQPSTASLTQTVNKTDSTTTVVSDLNPSAVGDNVTFTATVNAAGATGTVQFNIDGTDVGTPVNLVGGQAGYATNMLAQGAHTVVAVYSGDADYAASTSPALTQTVGPVRSAVNVTLASNNEPSNYGESVTFTSRVTPVNGGAVPTGTVTFTVDGVDVSGPVTLSGTGRASYTTTALTGGLHTVIATYNGSLRYAGASSAPFTQQVDKVDSRTTVTSNFNPSVYGQMVVFTATVTPRGATGTVQFQLDGANIGGPVAVAADGRALIAIDSMAVGRRSIRANYSGDVNYRSGRSSSFSQTVNKASTKTVVRTSLTPAPKGTLVTFSAAVTPVAPGAGVPTGTVQFRIDGVNAGPKITLDAGGRASYSTKTLTVGTHTVTAVYSGSTQFTTSTAANISQRVY